MKDWLPQPYPYTEPAPAPVPRPRHISGLALLRGVFLSTGSTRSASDLDLVAAGIGFLGLGALSSVLAYTVTWAIAQFVHDVPLVGIYTFSTPYFGTADPYMGWRVLIYLIRITSFLVALRLSPIAGYHAAEHKVVNAIEQDGVLELESVRRMPKEHFRCGSNLLPAAAPLLLQLQPDVDIGWPLVVVLTLAGFLTRHQIGWAMQALFTTKEPSDKQLRRGIESGQRLIDRWLEGPRYESVPAKRMYARGYPQMLLGLFIGGLALTYLERGVYWLVQWGL